LVWFDNLGEVNIGGVSKLLQYTEGLSSHRSPISSNSSFNFSSYIRSLRKVKDKKSTDSNDNIM